MNRIHGGRLALALLACAVPVFGQSLPSTAPLPPNPDFSKAMVAGIDRMALGLIEKSKESRRPTREKLRAAIGLVDARLPVLALELMGDTTRPALLKETANATVRRARWPVLEGVWGEGLLIHPKGKVRARVVLIPDAGFAPESMVTEAMLASGCQIVIPALVDRATTHSRTDSLGISTNIPHREWIYRQSFELGRHIIGHEVQKTLAVVDWFKTFTGTEPVVVAGFGEGGMQALLAAAIDDRISAVYSAGYFGPRENVWREPLDRNVFGLLRDFGDAEVVSLLARRPVVVHRTRYPELALPKPASQGARAVAAPGQLVVVEKPDFDSEAARALALEPGARLLAADAKVGGLEISRHLAGDDRLSWLTETAGAGSGMVGLPADAGRQKRLVRDLERFTQSLLPRCEAERARDFWKSAPVKSIQAFEAVMQKQRDRFWNDVIGRLPDPDRPVNARSRMVRENAKVSIHEVTLDVWDGVFAWGWLCLPKDIRPGERRAVVVCQHGLEGLPADTMNEDKASSAWKSYKAFALKLAEQGFITFAPHNPYRGGDAFRTLQRKLNPLGLSLYSVINGQHQRILEWLKSQPYVADGKIAFYGLSYGGKSAMRTPAVLKDYCLSICSGDFNEWARYCVSTELPIPAYVHTIEYEIWEWNLARAFNYAEMAALIAPRPFMVERGHDDGCGTDEWVNYEFAKVRRLYDKLGIGGRSMIEHFDGPHTINGEGTFRFLREHLGRHEIPAR
ncbi:MAG: alpha/beta hydrolase family protein [Planctomycetota bacterium]